MSNIIKFKKDRINNIQINIINKLKINFNPYKITIIRTIDNVFGFFYLLKNYYNYFFTLLFTMTKKIERYKTVLKKTPRKSLWDVKS